MSNKPEDVASEDRPFLWRELEQTVRHDWKLILIFAAIGIAWATLTLHLSTYVYRAQMQVSVVQGDSDVTSSSRLGALSGLASLAGLSTPTSRGAVQFALFTDSLYWRDQANRLAGNQALMRRLYHDEWDEQSQTWREPPHGVIHALKGFIRSALGLSPRPAWHAPDGANIQELIADRVHVLKDPRKPYIATIQFDTADPEFSLYFLWALDKSADSLLRQTALDRAKKNIDYLSSKLQQVTIAEHRQAIIDSLSDQEKAAMVAGSSAPFAAEIVEAPWVSDAPVSPSASQVLLTSVLIWGLLGLAIAVINRRYPIVGAVRRLLRLERRVPMARGATGAVPRN